MPYGKKFMYRVNIPQQTAQVQQGGKIIFSLDFIPDWTPANLSKKIQSLTIFS
jgi:hypothetical protein